MTDDTIPKEFPDEPTGDAQGRRSDERRDDDRRDVADRREKQLTAYDVLGWDGVDRRKSDRRSTQERRQED